MLLLLVLGLSAEEGEREGALDVVVAVDGRRHRRDDPLPDPLVLAQRVDGLLSSRIRSKFPPKFESSSDLTLMSSSVRCLAALRSSFTTMWLAMMTVANTGKPEVEVIGLVMQIIRIMRLTLYKLPLLVSTVLGVEGALVVVGVDAGELDLVAGLADVAEVTEKDGVFGAGESAGGNLLSPNAKLH